MGVIKEQQRKNLKKRKKMDGKLSQVENFLSFREQKLSQSLNWDYALAETSRKMPKMRKSRKFLPVKVSAPKVVKNQKTEACFWFFSLSYQH